MSINFFGTDYNTLRLAGLTEDEIEGEPLEFIVEFSAYLNPDELDRWCDQCLNGIYKIEGNGTASFTDEMDAMAFKMCWTEEL